MGEHLPLLELQRLDASADRLHARREALPERASLAECEATLRALAEARAEAGERRIALGREERRVDELVADLEARVHEVEGTLYSGKVGAPKELEALQEELKSFQRRQREREDEELAVLEQEEQLDREIAEMDARRAELEGRHRALTAAIAEAEAEIDAGLSALGAQRADVVAQLAEDLLAAYEKLRGVARLSGRAAVAIEAGTCGGCRLSLPTSLLGRLRREAAPTGQCPGCGRILVL
jgi:predicted  nucleic acid-binding Zn-ribbon protein